MKLRNPIPHWRIAFWVLGFPLLADAEPFLAVQNGFKCSQCHVSPTGGGMRNDYGYIYSRHLLPRKVVSDDTFQRELAAGIKTGANVRFESITRFAERSEPSSSGFGMPEGNIYVDLELIRKYFSLYLDQRVAPSVESREAFLFAKAPKINGYLKAGKMLQPYGWRVYDDATFTRLVTQFTYATPRVGVEAGWEPIGPFATVVSLAEFQASALAYLLWNGIPYVNSLRMGVSGYRMHEGPHRVLAWGDSDQVYGFGIFGGIGLGKFALLGELDAKRTPGNGGGMWQQFGLLEIDWMASKGVNLRLGLDWLNPDTQFAFRRNGQSRVVSGFEIFPVQFLQVGAYYHFRQSVPAKVLDNQNELRLQAHAFY